MNELVCGIEMHIKLNTEKKLFCTCENSFGGEPNSRICPVCTGKPGTLPKLNYDAIRLAVKAGKLLGCKINGISSWDRKNYFYPDLPKSYQITQSRIPLCEDGKITLPDGSFVGIERIHVEEDAAKLVYSDGSMFPDFNRAGVPLIEIVSKPDIHTPEQAEQYGRILREILLEGGISDCKMQEGSLRCDVNVSVKGHNRVEIKNINSFKFVRFAVRYEYERQKTLIENGVEVQRETRRYVEKTKSTEAMRGKETAEEYMYLPEPDLLPLDLSYLE